MLLQRRLPIICKIHRTGNHKHLRLANLETCFVVVPSCIRGKNGAEYLSSY